MQKTKWTWVGVLIIFVAVGFLGTAGCRTAGPPPKAKPAPPPKPNRVQVTRPEFKAGWPFKINEGVLICKPGRKVVFLHQGVEYGLNKPAMMEGYRNPRPLMRGNFNNKQMVERLQPLIQRGLTLCR